MKDPTSHPAPATLPLLLPEAEEEVPLVADEEAYTDAHESAMGGEEVGEKEMGLVEQEEERKEEEDEEMAVVCQEEEEDEATNGGRRSVQSFFTTNVGRRSVQSFFAPPVVGTAQLAVSGRAEPVADVTRRRLRR